MTRKEFRFCKKCLTRDMMDKNEFFKDLQDMINNIKPDRKTEPQLYEDRLKICTDCDYLTDGMCRACGCYVELRAAVTSNSCSYNKW